MDEFNNDRNPFEEQKTGGDPYAGQENTQQQNPYFAQENNAYGQQNPYAQQNGNPYQQNNDPYNQPNQNPYNQQQPNVNPYQQNFNPYAQQGGWQGMQPAQYNAAQMSTGMATASLVLGIISIVMCLPAIAVPALFFVFFLIPIIGLILGIVYKTKRLPVGKGLSTAGIVTSVIGLLLPIVILVFSVVFVLSNPEYMKEYMNNLREHNPEQYQEYLEQLGGFFPEWFESVLFFIFK